MKQRFTKRTRLVSALLTLAMVFTFLPFSAFAEEELTDGYGIIELAEYILPDKAFREYLKKFDTNNDGKLAPAERYAVKEIDVASKNISNLFGIQFFPNLKMLYCDNNQLTELDVRKNTALVYLDCAQNQLTELDVRQNAALWGLFCDRNQLSSLDVSNNTALDRLDCHLNNLTSLDLRYNTKLKQLGCDSNNLTSLDVSQNPELWLLNCSINQLTELDVSKNTQLQKLYCSDNQLTELDLSRNNKVFQLEANNNYLTSLNVDNTSIDIDNSSSIFAALGNTYPITVGSDRTFDLSTLPGTFDVTKATRWNGGTVRGNTLTVNAGVTKVTYLYDCGKRSSYTFTLNVTVVPEDSIAIDASNFPDPDFRTYVKAEFDKDNNNSLSESERNAVTVINVKDKLMETLEGIEFFPNLKELDCSINQLSRLDVSKNTALEKLDCSTNQLSGLDVSRNAKLKYLYCSQNELTSLDVSQTAVTTLKASSNQITIKVEETSRTFDLRTLPGKFEVSNATNWNGGTVDGSTLKVDEGATRVTYDYNCGKGLSRDFALNVKVVPDGTVTPPSGGGTTIPPEAGKYQLTVTDGVATVNGKTGAVLNVKPGDTVTLTADTTKFPENEEFGWWEITPYGSVSNTLTGQYQRTATFTMPNENVSARAMSKSAGVSTGGDDGGGGGGGAAILLVGGAAVAGLVGYSVYSYVSEQQLKALLPEGVAMPENRAQTALLLWNTAGRPEPAEAPAFKDVADPDTAKAAQWCVEHGLMDQKLGGRFAPDNSDPAYKTLNAYQQLVG